MGRSIRFVSESEGWSSNAAICESQISVARSSHTMKSTRPAEPNSIGKVRIHFGVCEGARFS